MKNIFTYIIISVSLFMSSCDTAGLSEVPMEQFIGTWSLQGRGMFEGMEIEITKEDELLIGRVSKLNDNKYIQLFSVNNDVWVSEISRRSNYQFRLTEKKIARELFALYGLSSSNEFKVEFIDKDTIGLSEEGKDPKNATIRYVRIK
ncbi:hypothetical protein SAMN05661096_03579 [Marivirga sericea]|uniref:Lipocalin-like domain-containing protein n=1 Tax=Marivirga sericea TaxID=1028 RepID=A0A1X7L626_9BACT|nr:hypothetical protein [Marivirga sericea]SMG49195.1 hypothetical protein SAMN05661096_03579 [Marivirga sericea]